MFRIGPNMFVSLKTGDMVVDAQGSHYVVVGLQVDAVKGVVVQMRPVASQVVTANAFSLRLASPLETSRRMGQPVKAAQRLVANNIAQLAWEFGQKRAISTVAVKASRLPFTQNEMSLCIKTIIKRDVGQQTLLTQSALDNIVKRLASTQGYLVKKYVGDETFATAEFIAQTAVHSGNNHNRRVLEKQS